MRNDTKALGQEIHDLRVPVVGAQRPAVMEHQWLAASPILVKNLGAVFGLDEAHGNLLGMRVGMGSTQRSAETLTVAGVTGDARRSTRRCRPSPPPCRRR